MYMIITHTPLFVWALLAFILWAGWSQSRTRLVHPLQIIAPAFAMSLYGFYGTGQTFGWNLAALAVWALGALTAFSLFAFAGASTQSSIRDGESGRYRVPGSFLPLFIFLAIFLTKYAMGIMKATAPELMTRLEVMLAISALLGACAGTMFRRFLGFRSAMRRSQPSLAV